MFSNKQSPYPFFKVRTISIFTTLFISLLVFSSSVLSSSFNSPAAPTDAAVNTSKMYTVDDIYNRLDAGTSGTDPTTKSGFTEPTNSPASSSKDLNDVMSKAPSVDDTDGATTAEVANGKKFWSLRSSGDWGLKTGTVTAGSPAVVPKTGQTKCYDASTNVEETCASPEHDMQDGQESISFGVAHASPRFTNNSDGTVTDNTTGLIWLTKANCIKTDYPGFDADGKVTWSQAFTFIKGINDSTYDCGDKSNSGTHQTDWRLPNTKELYSLIDFQYYNPSLSDTAGTAKWSEGNPFSSVVSWDYWSSTTAVAGTGHAWVVDLTYGGVSHPIKTNNHYVW
ncbi:MAG: DUF1566 domain-containing protein, partial [Gammaproteobacteria bacterium]|nr:DUF1566 domain-containing protein [Gammaproteobacteria bacterium]